jgi:hypothetical protein
MHICYVADARSPIAKNWISHFVARKYRVTVISSYPWASDEIPVAQAHELPFALSSLALVRHRTRNGDGKLTWVEKSIAGFAAAGFPVAWTSSARGLLHSPFVYEQEN